MISCNALVLATLVSLIAARPPDITFLCDEMPEICINMCWAVRCANPSFSQYLTLDFPTYNVQNQRSVSAGCGPNNMCDDSGLHSTNKTGHRGPPYLACNVYPFASTHESTFPNGHQVSRCVPEAEQCKQRAELELLSRKYYNASPPTYGSGLRHGISINFGNPGNVKYCNNDPCVNDGFEVQDGAIRKRSVEPLFKYYKTRSGMMLASVDELETPANFTRRVGSNEVVPVGFETWFERTSMERLHFMGDTVVERVSAHSFNV